MNPLAKQQDGTLLFGILRMARVLDARLNAALAPLGLSVPTLATLQYLARLGNPISLGVLSGYLGCVKSNVTQLIDRLEAEKLVQRVPDVDDRRSVLAAITEEGQLRCRAGALVVEAAELEILEGLTLSDRKLLATALVLLGERLGSSHS